MAEKEAQRIRFKANSRQGDWLKGDGGNITKILALPPQNQKELYIVTMDNGNSVWATEEDIEAWDQLSLFPI